jgi:phthiocerol/phenolphthiocerol synthesis type-I polyketide synthase E
VKVGSERMNPVADTASGVAVVGMSCRFPGARNVEEFWDNVSSGVESITFFGDDEITTFAENPSVVKDPRYVKAQVVLEDVDLFDASFFGIAPGDARILDPQHRLLMECAWEALEGAGYDPDRYNGNIGVYAGAGKPNYLWQILTTRPDLVEPVGIEQLWISNGPDFLSTRISYKLNLKGPSVTIQTGCSTSLVAIHMAYEHVLSGQCDLALAGGVSVGNFSKKGYLHKDGYIFSRDGHCRTFDAEANGTVAGSGVGLVLLKRLEDAVEDGDRILGIIKGSAINNDGAAKIGYVAPSVEGQARAIAEAILTAGIHADSIGYVEAHGTATRMGDPIEVEALTRAFRTQTAKTNFCGLGSVKTNIGHADAAAGVAGLIKAILALQHGKLPPSLHFRNANPQIDFSETPFYVVSQLREWTAGNSPRRAGVSSFGMGGTNAHVILEEAPVTKPSCASTLERHHLLLVSARTASALRRATKRLSDHLQRKQETDIADVAYTLQTGRKEFGYRHVAVCRTPSEASAVLENFDRERTAEVGNAPEIVFMFPREGQQYPRIGYQLCQVAPEFARVLGDCAQLLMPELELDIRLLLYGETSTQWKLTDTFVAQPVVFAVEYALAKLWIQLGVSPTATIGHGLGEYVAACLAGVITLKEALHLVVLRARLMQGLPKGLTLEVHIDEEALRSICPARISIVAVHSASLCVVSGAVESVRDFERRLQRAGCAYKHLSPWHYFDSVSISRMLQVFREEVRRIDLRAPRLAYISSLTGRYAAASEVTDVNYWVDQMWNTVQFGKGLETLLEQPGRLFLEVGPGQLLSTALKQYLHSGDNGAALASLLADGDETKEELALLKTIGQLWLRGMAIDWDVVHEGKRRRRVPLPTYPFERQRFWIDSDLPCVGSEKFSKTGASSGNSVLDGVYVRESDSPMYEIPRRSWQSVERGVPDSQVVDSDIESKVIEILCELLGVEEIGIHDDFFALGGHSLMATQLLSRLRQSFNVEVPVDSFFDQPTVDELVKHIANFRKENGLEPQILQVLDEVEALGSEQLDIHFSQTADSDESKESN